MKKILCILLASSVFFACKKESKSYVTFSGKITNKNSDSLVILGQGLDRYIPVNEQGIFKDTITLKKEGSYIIFDGQESASIFLRNGSNIHFTADAKHFSETVVYTGEGVGVSESNLLTKIDLINDEFFKKIDVLTNLPKDTFDIEVNMHLSKIREIANSKKVDSLLTAEIMGSLEFISEDMNKIYEEKAATIAKFPKGMVSPKFKNYENYKGGATSLEDLKGKYVYIDVWATWCAPCKAEIPYLKELEKQFHNKNIEFVSISVDRKEDYEKWKKMVADKELSGIQLIADKEFDSDFIKGYEINAIPRFILIDPNGNILYAEAPRPSAPGIIEIFNSLNI